MSQPAVDRCVEALCQQGCSAVWRQIEVLEAGHDLPETEHLSPEETSAVLAELKSIMAVYDGSCSIA